MRKPSQLLLTLTIIILTLTGIGNVQADNVPAGFDLFETDSATTSFSFINEFTIPPEFFDPGSDPFSGTVQFKGVPLGSFMGEFAGTADTVVKRQTDAVLPGPGTSDTIPIELVTLSLVSASPITVTYTGTGSELWDVHANVSPSRPSSGTMTIHHLDPMGGTFDAQFTVYPLLTFTRQTDGAQRILDVGSLPLPPESIDRITLRSASVPWVHTCPPPILQNPHLNNNFCASATSAGKELTKEQAAYARHGILPANAQPKPVGGILFSGDILSLLARYVIAAITVAAIVTGIVYTRRLGLGRLIVHRRS